jgi:FtsP/CotA-like multicopper oxidase with cupredoxin domain
MHRRQFISSMAGTVAAASAGSSGSWAAIGRERPEFTIRIEKASVELAPGVTVKTTTYNGGFPGPLLRLRAGQPVVIDVINATAVPEQLHWHGQFVAPSIDGASEEGTPYIAPHGRKRLRFTPGPAGFRFYHTHLRAGGDLAMGQYSGQVGPVFIEPQHDPGRYDREVFLTLKEFEPSLSHGGDMAQTFLAPATTDSALGKRGEAEMRASLASGKPKGFEVGYGLFTINGRMLGHGEPIRVRRGERVLFHILNGSATEIRSLALPGHTFTVVALDGNPVPNPTAVPVLWIGTAERVDAIVEMNEPGVWILGDTSDDDRQHGMGIVVEYAGSSGAATWAPPPSSHWDYTRFGHQGPLSPSHAPDGTFVMTFAKDNAAEGGFNVWTINGRPYAGGSTLSEGMDRFEPSYHLREGRRYRISMRNASDDIHPIHLHRHTFELTRVAGKKTSGVMKDVAMLGGYQTMEIDFTANNPGLTLFHCHQQLHMDFGFMALFDYV